MIPEQDPPARNRLLSRAELADLIQANRATITNWAGRHAGFPRPVRSGEDEYYWLEDIARWGDSRPVHRAELLPGESSGGTYGQRLRRAAARSRAAWPSAAETERVRQQEILDALLGQDAKELLDGVAPDTGYLALLMSIIFLRRCAPAEWRKLHQVIAAAGPTRLSAQQFIRQIGDLADRALRERAVMPGVRAAVDRLKVQSTSGLVSLVSRCEPLGGYAFLQLLDAFAAKSRLGAADSFTPREVACLMARLVAADAATGLPVYDPYLRGGELLRAVMETRDPTDHLRLQGDSPYLHTVPFAGMSIMLHDDRDIEMHQGGAPWGNPDRRQVAAGAVLLNPPFNLPPGGNPADTSWPFGEPPADKSHFAWLQYAVTCLAPGARAAVLMPRHAGTTSDQRQRAIRERMVKAGAIEAVIMLPGRMFPASTANVNLWIVGRGGGSPGQVLLIDATRMLNKSKKGPMLARGAAEQIAALYVKGRTLEPGEVQQLTGGGQAVVVEADAIRDAGFSLSPADYLNGTVRGNPGLRLDPSPTGTSVQGVIAALAERAAQAQLRDREVNELLSVVHSTDTAHDRARVQLGELCSMKTGPSFSRLGLKERTEQGTVPVVMPRHLRDRRIVATGIDKVSADTASGFGKFQLTPGDILCVRSGRITEPAIVQEDQEGWLYGTNLIRLRIDRPERVDASYLLGFLSLPETQEWIRGQAARTATSSIKTESLKNLAVTCPPIEEQCRIGALFGAIDAQISVHRQMFEEAAAAVRVKVGERLVDGSLFFR
jgi:type I restriction enzyme M protein